MLKSRTNLSNNPATVIAQIVSALKTMSQNLNYGDQVLHILNADPIWAEFRDQNHDLFITDSQKRLCIQGKVFNFDFFKFNLIFLLISITGASNPVAGYLTQAPSRKTEVLMSPPPIDRNDPLTGYPTE